MTLQPRAASILGILGILGLCFSLPACNPSMTSADGGGPLPADIGMAAELSPRCASSSQCTGDEGAPICAAQRCVPCTSHTDSECAVHRAGTPRCDVTSGHCVACLPDTQAADCGKAVPVCDHNACRACRSHYECSALVCNSDGSCAAPSDVVYVDAGNCSGMTPDGSSTKPFCQITDALLATNAFGPLAGKSIIRVAGSATGYGGITIDRSLTLVGPGRNVAPTAAIHGTFKSAAISVSGAGISVSLDGFDIGAAQDGISCTSGSNVTVLRSYIHGLAGAGVTATGCTFTLDGSTVTNNGGGGVIMANTSYRIVNNFITQNGPEGAVFH